MLQRRVERVARQQAREAVVVGIPARPAQQAVQLDRQAPDRQQQRDRRDHEPGVFGAQRTIANDRQRKRAEHDRAPDPVHAAAARHHAAGNGREPQDAQNIYALVAETDDQDRRDAGERLLELQQRHAAREQLHACRRCDRGEAGDADCRLAEQARFGEDQRDARDADRAARPCGRVTCPLHVRVAFDRDHGNQSVYGRADLIARPRRRTGGGCRPAALIAGAETAPKPIRRCTDRPAGSSCSSISRRPRRSRAGPACSPPA